MKDLKIENCYHCPLRRNGAFQWCRHKDFGEYEVEIIDVDIIHPKCPLNNHITNDVLEIFSGNFLERGKILEILTMENLKVKCPKNSGTWEVAKYWKEAHETIKEHFRRK